MGAVCGGRRGVGSRAGGECVALLVLLSAAATAAPARAQEPAAPDGEPRGPEVEAVRFPGAERLDRQLLEDAIVTRETECRSGWLWLVCEVTDFAFAERKAYLDPAELERDRARLEELYQEWGFPDARVSVRTEPQPDGDVVVEFPIEEGEPIIVRAVEVRG